MSRSRVVLALLAVSLLTSACALPPSFSEIVGCKDLSLGEQTIMRGAGYNPAGVYERAGGNWQFLRGSGTLEPSESGWEAQYTATEVGTVTVFWLGIVRVKVGLEAGTMTLPTPHAQCTFEVFDPTVDIPVVAECETSRFKVEVGPRPVTAFHNGYVEFDTYVTTVAGMSYDTSEFELSVGGDDELLAVTLDPRVSPPGDTTQPFSWHVTIDRVTGQDLPVGEHLLDVTVSEESGLSVGTTSCTLPFTIDVVEYGG